MSAARSSNVRWLLIFWLFVLSAVAYLDRVNISVAGRAIAATYGLSNIQLGWIFSAFLIGYALFQTVGGYLAQRFGPRRVLAAGVFWWGIFTAVTASIPAGIGAALLFGLAHVPGGTPLAVVIVLLLGVVLTAVYAWTRNLATTIGIHAAFNLASVLALFLIPSR